MQVLNKIGSILHTLGRLSIDAANVARARLKHGGRPGTDGKVRLTIVQSGDYREAFLRFASGGAENYYGQKYTVDFVASLARNPRISEVTVISFVVEHDLSSLGNGINAIGVALYPRHGPPRYKELLTAIKLTSPTHLIVMTPSVQVICWGILAGIPVLPMLADSFRSTGLKATLDSQILATLLNATALDVVANHNLAASLDLQRIGVKPQKIVPFDWPPVISAQDYAPKTGAARGGPFRLLYVGSLLMTKGVGDAIVAVALLRRRGLNVVLSVMGRGESDEFRRMAVNEGVETEVVFTGPKNHSDVIVAMREHDAILVPSHWSYPEGLPMTIYEALCTRTPLVTSNHPMFSLKIRDQVSALMFPERNSEALADCVHKLMSTPDLYERLSSQSEVAANGFLCPLKYDRLISEFIFPDALASLARYSLVEHDYAPSES